MCGGPPPRRSTPTHPLPGQRPQPRLVPERQAANWLDPLARSDVEHLHLRLLDDVALQDRVEHQPGRPVRQHRPERDVQPVQLEPVPVRRPVGHRQPGRQAHLAVAAVPVPLTMAAMPATVIPVVLAVLLTMASTLVFMMLAAVATAMVVAPSVLVVVAVAAVLPAAVPVVAWRRLGSDPGRGVGSLGSGVQQPRPPGIKRRRGPVACLDVHVGTRARHLPPQLVQDGL
jgi:hypothetical protein